MLLKDLIEYLESFAPVELQENYDNSGLWAGDPDQEIDSALLCLDITREVVEEAIENHHSLIVSHHPIIFRGLKTLSGKDTFSEALRLAIKYNIALYGLHTNLDKVDGGVSFKMAQMLDIKHLDFLKKEPTPLGKKERGFGAIGYLAEPISFHQFLPLLKAKMKTEMVRHTQILSKPIHKIALCGGAGYDLLEVAIDREADLYISSDFKYHNFFEARGKIIIADIGHYESEQFTPQLILEIISNKFPTFALSLSKLNTNPIYYSY